MKIEMGESLFYSWLRHVKDCQVVQTNWKPSPSWQLLNESEIKQLLGITSEHFQNNYGYNISKKSTFSQFILQAEIDVLGVSLSDNQRTVYAVDVAFHEYGLRYGNGRHEAVEIVLKKLIRTALCMIGYFGVKEGEIVFASPKIYNAIIEDLMPSINDLNTLFQKNGYGFNARIIANDEFNDLVLKPIMAASEGVADTSELFMRGYQLTKMFEQEPRSPRPRNNMPKKDAEVLTDDYSEFKIGKVAQIFLRKVLESGTVSEEEIAKMQRKDYSTRLFGISFPLLVSSRDGTNHVRYYSTPLVIHGKEYFMCSQWVEYYSRSLLNVWLKEHGY